MSIDQYKHMNNDREGAIISIEDVAVQVERLNYGMHRIISALIRARRERSKSMWPNNPEIQRSHNRLADRLEALLNEGLF